MVQQNHDERHKITPDQLNQLLASHARWLACDGRDGTRLELSGQDLSGLDLHGADLRHADLRGCNLEGTDLREARLDFADLTGSTRLLAQQLAGADVAGAILPPDIHVFERLDHIKELTVSGRKVFLFMLLAVGYTWLTIATTTDVELLTNAATSPLPIILTELALAGFYWAAPLVLLGFYVYFHLSLQALWEGLASLPAVFPDGRKVHDKAYPWLLTGLVGAHFKYLRETRSLMSRLQTGLSIVLAWYVIPLTLAALWLRYLPRHDPLATGFHVVVLMLTAIAGIAFYRLMITTLRGAAQVRWPGYRILRAPEVGIVCLVFVFLPVLSYGAIVGGPPRASVDPRAWVPVLFATFGYSPFATFRDRDVSRRPELWSESNPMLDMVRGAALRSTDLHRADAAGAFLVKADLREADLQLANLELADLRRAKLANGNLLGANLLQANLREAGLQGADLRETAMVRTDLRGALMQRADLRGAFLTQADLRRANLFRADLSQAHLGRADLRGANLELAILTSADLRGANLGEVTGLNCFQLHGTVRDGSTRLPESLNCEASDETVSGK